MTTDLRWEVNATGIDSMSNLTHCLFLISWYQFHIASSRLKPPTPSSSPPKPPIPPFCPHSPLMVALPIFLSTLKPSELVSKLPLPHASVRLHLSAAAAACLFDLEGTAHAPGQGQPHPLPSGLPLDLCHHYINMLLFLHGGTNPLLVPLQPSATTPVFSLPL